MILKGIREALNLESIYLESKEPALWRVLWYLAVIIFTNRLFIVVCPLLD